MSNTDLDLGPRPNTGDIIHIDGRPYVLKMHTTTNTNGLNYTGYAIIQGGAEDADSTDGDGTSTDKDDSTSGDNDDKQTEDEKKFTQADVNALVTKEVSRATRGKLDPKELGFESAKDLKEFFDSAKERSEADKSEADKALEEARREATETATKEVLTKANQRVLKAEFLVAAKEADVKYTSDAFALAPTLDIWQDVEIDDDGNVTGLDADFFKALQEQKPFLWAGEEDDGKGNDVGAGRRSGEGDRGQILEKDLRQKYPALPRAQ